jgi:hypothetical protein
MAIKGASTTKPGPLLRNSVTIRRVVRQHDMTSLTQPVKELETTK